MASVHTAFLAGDLATLLASPDVHVLRYDFERHAALLIRLSRAQLEEASFLDDRLLNIDVPHGFVALQPVVPAALNLAGLLPLHYVFHTGHVGSTLVSRLLGSVRGVLSLREPFPLRQVAVALDQVGQPGSRIDPERLRRVFDATIKLLQRGFPESRAVVVKATSVLGRMAPELMAALPESRAIYLNVRPETYVATYLSNPNSLRDLLPIMAERIERLRRFGLPEQLLGGPWSDGERAALAWLAESLSGQHAAAVLGDRLLRVDFDALLADVPAALGRVAHHFVLEHDPEALQCLRESPLLGRYSKASAHAFSPDLRKRLLMDSARIHADEIQRGTVWLERAAAVHAASRDCLASDVS